MHRRAFLLASASAAAFAQKAARKDQQVEVLRSHLDLLTSQAELPKFDGKDSEANTAMACYRIAKITGETKYADAATLLASRIVKAMRASAVGLLDIKEWGPGKIMYGAPPPLGYYGAYTSLILAGAGRMDDVRFIGGVLDRYPWYEKGGWWATSANVKNMEPLEPLDSPGIINKNAGMVMACSVVSELTTGTELSARLRARTLRCLNNILAAQHDDGYWNYKFTGPEPGAKDTVGYFMLTTNFLLRARELAPTYRQPAFDKVLAKAEAFAMKEIAPMTAPNTGKQLSRPIGGKTPPRYDPAEAPKRSYQLASVLAHGGYHDEAVKILRYALPTFPKGDHGQNGSQCAEPASMAAVLLAKARIAV